MADFLSSYWASILATATVTVGPALLYTFRDALVRGFWEASEEHVRDLIPVQSRSDDGDGRTTKIHHEAEPVRLSVDGRYTELPLGAPFFDTDLSVQLISVEKDHVIVKDTSPAGRELYPYKHAEIVSPEERKFRLRVNRSRSERGKLFAFGDEAGEVSGICVVFLHVENASFEDQSADVVWEILAGEPEDSYGYRLS